MDEFEETIRTYDNDVNRYITKLEFPTPIKELDNFMTLLIGKKVLDAGCGAGRDTKYFFDNSYDIIGMDSSKNMLEAARKRTKAEFILGNIRKTGFEDSSFDGVWCYNSLLHLDKDNLYSTLKEFYRLLVKRGTLFIATIEGEGEVVKESEKGTKYFYLYTKEYMTDRFKDLNFELISTKSYQRKDENFVDFIVKK